MSDASHGLENFPRPDSFSQIEANLDGLLSSQEKGFVTLFTNRAQDSAAGQQLLNDLDKPGNNIACGIFMYGLKRILIERNPQLAHRLQEFPPYEIAGGNPGKNGLASREVQQVFDNEALLRETDAHTLWNRLHGDSPPYNPFSNT